MNLNVEVMAPKTATFGRLVESARRLGGFICGESTRDPKLAKLGWNANTIISEEEATSAWIKELLDRKNNLAVIVGDAQIKDIVSGAVLETGVTLLVDRCIEDGSPDGNMPIMGDGTSFITVEDFCRNLYRNGSVELVES